MQQDKYTDKKGNPQEQIRVVVEEMEFLDSKKEIEIYEPKSDSNIYLRKEDAELNDKEMKESDEINDDDLPF
jgi:single-stranded DNA-binding protein